MAVADPIGSSHSRQAGLFGLRQVSEVTVGSPMAIEKPQQIPFLP
jgi:hypothetical protein